MDSRRKQETQSLAKSFGTANLVTDPPLDDRLAIALENQSNEFFSYYVGGFMDTRSYSPELKSILNQMANQHFRDLFFS